VEFSGFTPDEFEGLRLEEIFQILGGKILGQRGYKAVRVTPIWVESKWGHSSRNPGELLGLDKIWQKKGLCERAHKVFV